MWLGVSLQRSATRLGGPRMAHDDRCGGAKKSGCRCSGCAGSLHGWPGALRAVHTPSSREKHAPSPYAGLTYIETARLRHGKVATHRRTVEVADRARDDIIKWLAAGFEDPPDTAAKLTSQIAERIADKASDDLFKAIARESAKLDQLGQWRKNGQQSLSLHALRLAVLRNSGLRVMARHAEGASNFGSCNGG